MKNIVIVGAGWLGQPLGHCLANLGHTVVATRTTPSGCNEIAQSGLKSTLLNLDHSLEDVANTLASLKADLLFGCFPPGFRKGNGDQYAQHWQKLVSAAKTNQVEKIIMISSTTVYPNLAKEMTEDDASLDKAISNPSFSDNARVMLLAEQHLMDSGIDYAIIRCSGLIGPNRHPSRFVNKLRQVSTQAPANMLHLNDAIGISVFAASHFNKQIINATTPNTTNKAEFYQAALERVQSEDSLPATVAQADKRIIADKAIAHGYRFHFQHTLETI
ncbi:NAD(P)H-binding protein [Vibrio sp. LaRot3]|uniref:NAD(P)H-binding protein n=1 Tax=Vibrio sp. LaRot3 TaxID=2998829 RepID=UPI0022CDF12B|nr:NAD(P)H-binding protein [Vibrio sp. LaRot3]MDA0147213.1 NAD(P)H-binding protein [Vibrio sp. LaRot3]